MPKRKTEVRTVNVYLKFLMDRLMSIRMILFGHVHLSVNYIPLRTAVVFLNTIWH
jgi:hypothetical protein